VRDCRRLASSASVTCARLRPGWRSCRQAEGFGVHVPKGYIYAAMAFSALVEGLNMLSRNAAKKKAGGAPSAPH
jgi:hypothetical protein